MVLNELAADERLARLFSIPERCCALQLWILQIRTEAGIENRIAYGRLLPYSFANDTWSASISDNFRPLCDRHVQLLRVGLYFNNTHSQALLTLLSEGRDLASISGSLGLSLAPKLSARIGDTRMGTQFSVRPPTLLLNRNAPRAQELRSPHGSACAFSAAFVPPLKQSLFDIDGELSSDLAAFVIKELDDETGLRFGARDLPRLGEIELLVFPTLDDSERELLSVLWTDKPRVLRATLNPTQMPRYDRFQLRAAFWCDDALIHSTMEIVDVETAATVECTFSVPEHLVGITDAVDLEVHGFAKAATASGQLCCRWKIGFLREISLSANVAGSRQSPPKWDWLEKTLQSKDLADRLKNSHAGTSKTPASSTVIGGRKDDPWVLTNEDLKSTFSRLHPPASDGRFFEQLSEEGGQGRLDFVLWMKALLEEHQNEQVLIFDPYFEDAGVALIAPNTGPRGNYIIFTTLPNQEKFSSWRHAKYLADQWSRRFLDKPLLPPRPSSRINNLLASCERMSHFMRGIRLRVYALEYKAFHDRYILIVGRDQIPMKGFHLSNSIQKANENYPLLVTPIPTDTLHRVVKYAQRMLRAASLSLSASPDDPSAARLAFDSSQAKPKAPVRYEPLGFIDDRFAGDVIALCTGRKEFQGLRGERLRSHLMSAGILVGQSLSLAEMPGLLDCAAEIGRGGNDVTPKWEALGHLLANTPQGDRDLDFTSTPQFLLFLSRFLTLQSDRPVNTTKSERTTVIDPSYFKKSSDDFLASSNSPHHFHHAVKYSELTWPEYYAVRILWRSNPHSISSIVEALSNDLKDELAPESAFQVSLLSQVASEVALSLAVGLTKSQLDELLRSPSGMLKWMGLSALLDSVLESGDLSIVDEGLKSFATRDKLRVLGWMTVESARTKDRAVFEGIVQELHSGLPPTLSSDDTDHFVNSLRSHMKRLAWSEPWLFDSLVRPLLNNGRIRAGDLCRIWVKELASYIEEASTDSHFLFSREREGRVTEVAAELVVASSLEQQRTSIRTLSAILTKLSREIRKPLPSTSNWQRWNTSLRCSLWIAAFSAWVLHKRPDLGDVLPEILKLRDEALDLALSRPTDEWRDQRGFGPDAIMAFADEAGLVERHKLQE